MILPEDSTFEAWQRWLTAVAPYTALSPHEISFISVDDDHLELGMPVGDHARQPYGLLHGGMNVLLAESAASLHACWKIDLSEKVPVGIEINASHLESIADGEVRARAIQIRRSKTLAHHRIEIREHPSGRLLSTARMVNFYKERRR